VPESGRFRFFLLPIKEAGSIYGQRLSTDACRSCFSWLSAFRWVVFAIILVVQLQLMAVVFAPAALASPIITNLQLMRTDFGLIRSAIQITVMIFVVLGMVDRVCLCRFFLALV
jgi:hypothetical protein